ncbi:radical SAM/SPASM domain-containing protein [Anaerosporobacter sp.]|uniref:radical SAM/SPASM domain-containing protein n=1 Tax=Anaerosporobacter sp. TaxID=1872529 RepID=UPI00286F2C10|nr:radical SAM protein [Anaerosporobacter sp.]
MKKRSEHDGRLMHYEFNNVEKLLAEKHGESFLEYRKKWDFHRVNLVKAENPLYLVLDANTYCNLKCKMCEKNYYSKRKNDISMETIDKLVDECREMKLPSLLVGASAECLLNPDIKEILEKISTIGLMDKFLITNGTYLDDSIVDLLIKLEFERVYISLDAVTPETYSKIRGGNLQRVEQNIENLLRRKQEEGKNLPVVRVSFVKQKENEMEVDDFIDKWKDKVDIIDFQEMIDFSNINDLQEKPNIPYKCEAPFTTLHVDSYGNIYPCCTFYSKYFCLGNIQDMTLKEAWNCDKMNNLRNSILEGNMPLPCRNCVTQKG